MKITVPRKEMLQTLMVGGSMAGKSKTLPILNCVKISVSGLTMTIHSYDGKNSITKSLKIQDSENDTCFCVDCKDLTGVIRALRDESLTFDVDDYNIRILHKKGVQSFPLDNVSEFPQMSNDDMKSSFVLPADTLYELVSTAKNFIQSNDLRPQMASVYLGLGNNVIDVAATDGFSLFADYIPFLYEGTPREATINLNVLSPLLDMISIATDVTISIGDRDMSFKTEDSILTSAMLEYKYPNYKAIIPKDHSIEVTLDKEDAIDTLSRVMLTANKENCLVKLITEGMTMNVVSEDFNTSKKSKESILCEKFGEDIAINVKGTYLKTCLEQVKFDKVKMLMTAPVRPIVFKDDFYKNRIIMLMPMQA